MLCLKTIRYLFIILTISFIMANPVPINSAVDFVLNTNDINNNGNPDVLVFEGGAVVKNVKIYDVKNKSFKNIWNFSLPDNYIGYFTDASIVSFDDNNKKLLLIATLKNSDNFFFLFDIDNGKINLTPNNIISLPEKYSYLQNPQQVSIIDWDNDNDDEIAVSFSGAFRSILICDLINEKLNVIESVGEDFLSTTYSPILIGSGDLNGDKKQDLIVVDNGRKANARIYLNGINKNGLRILGLKDVGHLSFLSKNGVNFDGIGGDELFFASKKLGLHYIFVESVGKVNQAVTVKTELLIETINKIYIAEKSINNQIVTVDPDGNIGRYEITSHNGDLNVGIFENKKTSFSIINPNTISSIYFPNSKQLLVSAYNDIRSEVYFYKHPSFIEPAIDYSLQREDNRLPKIIINVNDSSNIAIPWIDSLQFYEFSSKSLLNGMQFSAEKKSILWVPNVNQLGFNEIFYSIAFKNNGTFSSINADTLTQIVLNQEIITNKDSILIYVNDKPNLQENQTSFNVIGGDDFSYRFKFFDRNIDSKNSFYFLDSSLEGITVDDSGFVEWKIPEKFLGKKDFNLCIDDGIQKDSIKIDFNIHPKVDFSLKDTLYIATVGEPFSLLFSPDTIYNFNSYKYSLIDAPKNMHINNNGVFLWEPNPSQIDLNKFKILISDGVAESSQSVSIYVNSTPLISSSPPEILHLLNNESFEFNFDSFDANSDASLNWSLVSGPQGMVVGAEGLISWVPDVLDFVNYTVSLSDGYNFSEYNGKIYINFPPKIISSPPKTINLGDTLLYKVEYEDKNIKLFNDSNKTNVLNYKIISGPSQSSFLQNSLLWIPDEEHIGITEFFISINDGLQQDIQKFSLFVNDVPNIFNTDTIFTEANKPLNHKILINDLNKQDIIDIDLINNNLGITIEKDTLQWLPDTSLIGNHVLTVRLNDGKINFNNDFTLNINVFSKPQFLNDPPKDAYVGIEYVFKPKINFFSKNSSLEIIESSSPELKLINNALVWKPSSNDANKDIHKVVLKAVGYKNRETLMEFFIKVHANPKISN